MNPSETSAGTALWSDMVEQDQNEPEGITIFPFENFRENRDEQLSIHRKAATPGSKNIQLDKEQAQASAPTVTSHSRPVKTKKTHPQAYPTAHSGYVQKQRNYYQASAAYAAPYSGYDQREWKSKQAPHYVQGYFQNTSAGPRQPPQFHPNHMNYVNHEVDDLRTRLQKKNNFLTREKEMRIAAEKDCYLQREKIKEVEKVLDVERHVRLVCVKELNRITENLRKSIGAPEAVSQGKTRFEEAHMLVLQDLETLNKQLQDNSDLETASQIRPQDEATEMKQQDLSSKDSATDENLPSKFNQEQMNNLLMQVNDLTNRLQSNDKLLTEEKEKRLAAEQKCTLKEEELQEVESRLKEEYHRRIVSEKELKWCKRTVDDLRLSSKKQQKEREDGARSAEALKELENVKKQLQEKTISNIELASKVKAQEQTIEHFECKVAELTMQIKSASETTNYQPETTADGPKSSAAEKAPEPKSVSTQTETFVSESVPELKDASIQTEAFEFDEVSELKDASTQTEASVSKDFSDSKEISTQTEASESEDVSEVKEVSAVTETVATEDDSDLKEVSIHQLEVIDEICEIEESEEIPNTNIQFLPQTKDPDPKTLTKPSLWRRFKKMMTPAHRRQYKSRRQIQSPLVTTNIPQESQHLPPQAQQHKQKNKKN